MRVALCCVVLSVAFSLVGCGGGGGEESGGFRANRRWWICQAEIADSNLPFMKVVRMRIAFRDAQDLGGVKHGFDDDDNGWEGGEDVAILTYEKGWGTDDLLDRQGIANCQVTVSTMVGGDLQKVVGATVFRLDGEQSWTRLADYVSVVENEPGKFAFRRCRQCSAVVPLNGDNCENCGLRLKQ
jgi:hypothetical protein